MRHQWLQSTIHHLRWQWELEEGSALLDCHMCNNNAVMQSCGNVMWCHQEGGRKTAVEVRAETLVTFHIVTVSVAAMATRCLTAQSDESLWLLCWWVVSLVLKRTTTEEEELISCAKKWTLVKYLGLRSQNVMMLKVAPKWPSEEKQKYNHNELLNLYCDGFWNGFTLKRVKTISVSAETSIIHWHVYWFIISQFESALFYFSQREICWAYSRSWWSVLEGASSCFFSRTSTYWWILQLQLLPAFLLLLLLLLGKLQKNYSGPWSLMGPVLQKTSHYLKIKFRWF